MGHQKIVGECKVDYQTFEKVNKFINVEAYIFFLTQELKQQYKLSLKELLILAYFYYKKQYKNLIIRINTGLITLYQGQNHSIYY